jgi:hypothetical protein
VSKEGFSVLPQKAGYSVPDDPADVEAAALELIVCMPWGPLIDDYLISIAAAGQRPATLDLRRDHLNHIARGIDCPPHAVTSERLVDWFGQQIHWKLETRRGYRNTARKFFEWGLQDRPPRHRSVRRVAGGAAGHAAAATHP